MNNVHLIKTYLTKLQVELREATYTHVSDKWREINYIPSYNKFYFICAGEGFLQIGNQSYNPTPHQMYLMPQGVKQSYSTTTANHFKKYWCHFTATIGEKNVFDFLQTPVCIDVKDVSKLTRLFQQLIQNHSQSEITAPIRAKGNLLEIIAFFLENALQGEPYLAETESMMKLHQVTHFLENNLDQEITIKGLATLVNFHPNYFIKFFRKHLGTSPIHYIIQLRIKKAKELLSASELTVTEIAEMTGFTSLYHFSSTFKKHTGSSPTDYRQIHLMDISHKFLR